MGNYNRDRGGRGGYGGGRDRGGRGGDRGGRPEMHHAVCYECGHDCEVPFRPTGDKPVYCSTCFGKQEGGGNDRHERRGNDRHEKKMFGAICDECGADCEVPFKPSPDKPIYCSDCFEQQDRPRRDEQPRRNDKRSSSAPSNDQFAKQFEALASKMDSIIELLTAQAEVKKPAKKEKPAVKEEKKKAPAKKEAAPKKEAKKTVKKATTAKKAAPKKAPAKKAAAPKKAAAKKAPAKKAVKKAPAKKK